MTADRPTTSVVGAWWARLSRRWWAILAIETVIVAVAFVDTQPWADAVPTTRERVVAIIAVAGVVLRRRWPLLTWALCVPAIVLSVALVTPLVAIFSVARRAPRWWVTAGVVVGTFTAIMVAAVGEDVASAGTVAVVQTVVYAVVFAVGPAACGLALAARRRLAVQLRRIVAMQEHERVLLTGSAVANERTRLAREMHDVVSHQVSLIALQAGALRVTASDGDTRALASTIRGLAVQTLDELRVMVGVLRNGPDTGLAPQPRLADIADLVALSGLPAVLDDRLPAGRPWSGQVERSAYRTVQEALTNAGKHAPGAAVHVELRADGARLTVTVRNGAAQGTTPAPIPSGGHGLIGLRERAELLGGRLTTRTDAAGGYELVATFVDPAVADSAARPLLTLDGISTRGRAPSSAATPG